MNYRHAYHAGNFADVTKHIILVALLKALNQKDAPYCCIDTHAGAGLYDLQSSYAMINKEFEQGILKVAHQKEMPPLVSEYLSAVRLLNNQFSDSLSSSLRYYPGSPLFLRHFLRRQDRLILTELHPEEERSLATLFAKDKHVITRLQDGYQALKAFLPPKERRGLILIDPPFERPSEYSDLLKALDEGLKRFETGVYAIWYPIKDRSTVDRFYRALKAQIKRPFLITELTVYPDTTQIHLNGSGMVIINPPWKLQAVLEETFPWLWKILSQQHQGRFIIDQFNV